MGLNFRCAFWFQAGVLRSIRQPIQVLDRIVARRSSAKSFKSLAERLQSSAKMLSGNPRIDCWYCTIEMSRPNSMPSRRPSSRPSRSPSSLPSRRPSSRPSILAPKSSIDGRGQLFLVRWTRCWFSSLQALACEFCCRIRLWI